MRLWYIYMKDLKGFIYLFCWIVWNTVCCRVRHGMQKVANLRSTLDASFKGRSPVWPGVCGGQQVPEAGGREPDPRRQGDKSLLFATKDHAFIYHSRVSLSTLNNPSSHITARWWNIGTLFKISKSLRSRVVELVRAFQTLSPVLCSFKEMNQERRKIPFSLTSVHAKFHES